MEETQQRKRKRRRRRDSELSRSAPLGSADADTALCLLLASVSKINAGGRGRSDPLPSSSLVKRCLRKVLSFLSKSDDPVSSFRKIPLAALFSVLPVLLKSNPDIACLSAKVVGMASLCSFDMNQRIASDAEILESLVSGLRSSNRRVKLSACGAVSDLATSLVGRQSLLEHSALETLMVCYLQVAKCFVDSVTLFPVDNGFNRSHITAAKEHELSVSLLDAVIVLVNSCNIKQLERVPSELSESFFFLLKELWTKLHPRMYNSTVCSQQKDLLSNMRVNDLAESIFRLSIRFQCTTVLPIDQIRRSIFGLPQSSFKDFIEGYWEVSPFLIRRTSNAVDEENIFNSFLNCINPKDVVHHLLSSVLHCAVSCPPIASDELDIFNFLKNERDSLGMPIKYQQDIRVLKAERLSNTEKHLFLESLSSCIQSPHVLSFDDIFRCDEAYKDGYTVAMRGMEFRFRSIAAITEGLASLFGQPSVGANLYLTPRNSQGLARHYDDHCVLVCQLMGMKQWTISSPRNKLLPRLYEPLDGSQGSNVDAVPNACMQILLKEGDILYIPRGYVHEAHTTNDVQKDSAGLSLHLTLAIEVEAPFEWEGFIHIALHWWFQDLKQHVSSDSMTGTSYAACIRLLHFMIMSLGDVDPMFRKACLVNSICFSRDTNHWLYQSQVAIFRYLLDKINESSKFMETLQSLERSIQKEEDPFRRIRWLESFNHNEEEANVRYEYHIFDVDAKQLYDSYPEGKETLEAAFLLVKSKFCKQVLLEDVVPRYRLLLEKYRKVRKQYLNGMLLLHRDLD
ncbi:uncharacterized protein LOC104441291 isoform X2 [Eucalyptus grandis]|uniref:uncharacterized protein LOC104441291 isoform X2 n=1 Tax=Eucalyptus grandis TaxID=71139 RepID=UPI00192E948B|nr:uncharacterized protein LOC104441291 isoform X2 [Eucalyptus grandis]